MHFITVQNLQILLWEKEESELDRLTSRLSQLYYENLLKVRYCQEFLCVGCVYYVMRLKCTKINADLPPCFLLQLSEPMDGLHQWLDAVYRSHIPCAVVSSLDRINMVEALERMGLRKYFQVCILLALKLTSIHLELQAHTVL